jgi:hypothetical protein
MTEKPKKADRQAAGAKAEEEKVNGMLDDALDKTFPASDPFSVGEATGTEPPTRPVNRRPPAIDERRVKGLAKRVPKQS